MTKQRPGRRMTRAFLFSGRPDPQWKLTKEQMKKWEQQWDKALLSENETERPAVLGYTGCLLQNDEHSYWIIYNGCVSFYDTGKVTSKKDDIREMEKWLLNTGPDEVKAILARISC